MRERPLGVRDYAFLSDCHTSALVSRAGSIDWYPPGRFDAPAVFGRVLDGDAGHWSICPTTPAEFSWEYVPDTLVLQATHRTASGIVRVTDALAMRPGVEGHDLGRGSPGVLLRRVEGIEGSVDVEMVFRPRPEFGLSVPLLTPSHRGVTARGGRSRLELVTSVPLEITDGAAAAHLTVRAGDEVDFALEARPAFGAEGSDQASVGELLGATLRAWRSWSALHTSYRGPYSELVRRSALALQGLTYRPSGAIVAAATTSLPERVGGDWNWDYRFAWLRDASLIMRAQWVAACPDEAGEYFDWLAQAIGATGTAPTQIVFGVEAERDLTEHELDHLAGFRGSRPVRVGNDAWRQKQLDVLGEVLDSAHLLEAQLGEFPQPLQRLLVALADEAARRWREPDSGMWEARDQERDYLSSKVMCWVALDRAVRLAPRLGTGTDVPRWERERDAVRELVLRDGWNEAVGAYTGAIGSPKLDASVLLMPLVGFLEADDPRMRRTIETIDRQLRSGGLVRRWDEDPNGFVICSYWLVECLAMAGQGARATELFEQVTAHASDLGLLAEMIDAANGEMLGNVPQALSHAGLINAAWTLGGGRVGDDQTGHGEIAGGGA